MRKHPRLRQTPVVVVSGAALTEDILPPEESYQALIPKPFTLMEVIDAVEPLIDLPFEDVAEGCGNVIQLKCSVCDNWKGNGGCCCGKNRCSEFTV